MGRPPALLLTSASHTNSTWSAAGSLISTTGLKWVYLLLDNSLNFCTGGIYWPRRIDRSPLSARSGPDTDVFVFRPTQPWLHLQRAPTWTVWEKWTKSSSILLWLFCVFNRKKQSGFKKCRSSTSSPALVSSGPCLSSSSWASSSPRSRKPTMWLDSPGEAADRPHPPINGYGSFFANKTCIEVT